MSNILVDKQTLEKQIEDKVQMDKAWSSDV